MHICYQSSYVDTVVGLLKPFMTERLQDQLFFHGDDLGSLYKVAPKECLPQVLGGECELKSYSKRDLEEMDKLLEFYDRC